MLWLAGGVIAFLLLSLPLVFRRREFALYRSVGAGRNPTALIFAVANVLLALVGHVTGLAWSALIVAWVRRETSGLADMALQSGASALICVALLTCGCVAMSRGSMAAYIHRQL